MPHKPEITDEMVVALYTECCGFLRAGNHWSDGSMHSAVPHVHTPILRLAALPHSPALAENKGLQDAAREVVDHYKRIFNAQNLSDPEWTGPVARLAEVLNPAPTQGEKP